MLTFTADPQNPGCYYVWNPASKYDAAIGYISPNEHGVIRYHPSVSTLYNPEMLEDISAFIRGLQLEGAKL